MADQQQQQVAQQQAQQQQAQQQLQQQQQQLQQQQLQQQQQQQQQPQQQRASSSALTSPVSVQQPPQPIMATANTLRSATPLPLQMLPGAMHNPAYLPQFPYNQQQQMLLQNAAVQAAAMQMNHLNIIQGRAPGANSAGGLLSPSSTQLAAQLAAVANSTGNLQAVSMALPVTNASSTKASANGNKAQAAAQGQQPGQGQAGAQAGQSQGQAGTAAATPALVAGKPAMLPQQSGAPLMLGQIATVFSQAGNVAPTFNTQSKGQSIAMPIQAQPQLVNSQSPIRLTQPQLVTNTGQIISSQNMLANPALLQAMAAGLHPQVWGLTNTGQLVQQTMLDNASTLQGNANPQGMQLAPQPLLTGQGQSQAFLAGQSLYLRPLQPAQQIAGSLMAGMPGFTTALKGGKVQLEPSLQQQTQQQQQQQLKTVALGVSGKSGQLPATLGKTILPSTTRSPAITAKIQPHTAVPGSNQGARLNVPTIVPKQKQRARIANKSTTLSSATTNTTLAGVVSSAPLQMAIPVVLSSGAGTLSSKVVATATVLGAGTGTESTSLLKPEVLSGGASPAVTEATSMVVTKCSESEGVGSKTTTPTDSVVPAPALPAVSSSSSMSILTTTTPTSTTPTTPSKTDTASHHPSAAPTLPFQPSTSPATPDSDASPELKIVLESKEEEMKEEVKEEGEEEEEMETERPVMAVEALPVAEGPPPPPVAPLTMLGSELMPSTLSAPPMMEKQRAIVKPQILTHFIDGFIIQEGPEPFPVQRSSLLTEFVPPKPTPPVEKDSEDDTTENDDQPPPLLDKSQAHLGGTGEDVRKCEFCNKYRAIEMFRNSGRFCSTACSKRYSVAFTKRSGKKGNSTAGKFIPKKKVLSVKKGWRSGHGSRLPFNMNMRPPATEMSSSNSGQETSSSAASPPPQQDFDVEMEAPKMDPAKWNVVEVYEFVKNLPGCQDCADEFRQQEIDGQALLLLKEDHLMSTMNIKLGPALKICARINSMRQEVLGAAATPTTPTV